mmetsp:Transcript_759/g.996  ORF Transcript_759/g.996 Transcript_759/m.996 type:complete len:169 (-) Transcript_759:530-1036(-)
MTSLCTSCFSKCSWTKIPFLSSNLFKSTFDFKDLSSQYAQNRHVCVSAVRGGMNKRKDKSDIRFELSAAKPKYKRQRGSVSTDDSGGYGGNFNGGGRNIKFLGGGDSSDSSRKSNNWTVLWRFLCLTSLIAAGRYLMTLVIFLMETKGGYIKLPRLPSRQIPAVISCA